METRKLALWMKSNPEADSREFSKLREENVRMKRVLKLISESSRVVVGENHG